MPQRHPRLVAGVLLALAAILVAGCGGTRVSGPRTWKMSAGLASGRTWDVLVTDTSGRIDNAEVDPAGVAVPGGVTNEGGKRNVVIVPWVGGSCDATTQITVTANGGGLAVAIRTAVAGQACDAVGVLHAVRLSSSAPLAAATIAVTTN
jgi:hypothetical protein